jgi:hypothetical protein
LNDKSASPIPEPIAQLQRRFDEFRSSRPHRAKLPETLWESAVELARQHGLYSVAHPLRLDYVQLKKRRRQPSRPSLNWSLRIRRRCRNA